METDTPPILQNSVGHDIKRPGDPYEFDEEGASGACHMDGFKRAAIAVKEEPKDLKKLTTGNLFTSEGLQPSYKDLDQIFDNSDDTSSDEAVNNFYKVGVDLFLSLKFLLGSHSNSSWFE